ncbi:hypothetical protein [Pleionea litopenaei]|uniref:Ankyrin repeat protein n=1 Tax=Pleionea litopenaei TaxID=3070815 RepID=A0AA51RW77_9GAMM|nr:hypothetical protein [Pleionea sp. HL-JVS1]WMS88788.1 hypothetical protein Q9312_07680 [Pleionea sp. HL-JVS1]
MVKVYVLLLFSLYCSFGIAIELSRNVNSIKEGSCVLDVSVDIPVIVCNRTQEQLERLRATDDSKLQDPKGKLALNSVYKAAEFGGSKIGSLIIKENLNIENRFSDKFIAFLSTDNLGCVVRYDEKTKLLFGPCDTNWYDLAGRSLVGYGYDTGWNLSILPIEVKNGNLQIRPIDDEYDFYPEFIENTLSEKQRLKMALSWGRKSLLAKLITKTNVNETIDQFNNTPLIIALLGNGDNKLEVVSFLIDLGADVHSKNNLGSTPIEMAEHLGDKRLIKLINKKQ